MCQITDSRLAQGTGMQEDTTRPCQLRVRRRENHNTRHDLTVPRDATVHAYAGFLTIFLYDLDSSQSNSYYIKASLWYLEKNSIDFRVDFEHQDGLKIQGDERFKTE